ncbi:MAG: alpha-amylase family glycosyl hydrolase [Candidatus Sumerlaeota bacterium]|nr:alpha-amylase family glycosyl hydrolase [Candidatus Sumerlaeota bacterium]
MKPSTTPPITAPTASPTVRSGMGTILYPGGVAFRVWAPFADAVFAVGDFNQWSDTDHPFASEGNGYWSVEVPRAKIGDEYEFLIHNGAQRLRRKNPYASAVVNSSDHAIIHDPEFDWAGEDFAMPPWNELAIYEMHVGTFNGATAQKPGTFAAILPKLPYLRDLGINAIEIMPVPEFAMDFSWGYNPSQPFAVESALGGPQGLYQFVKAAHAHGIAVILDVVYNHFGPGDLDLWQFDGWSDSDHNGGIYFYDNVRAQTAWGATRPDYGRPEVRQYLRDNALFWLTKYRIDGLRFDSVINIRNRNGNDNDPANDLPEGWSLLQWINNEIRATQPWKITIAEDLQKNEWLTKDTAGGGAGFNSQWDAGFVHPIRAAIIAADDAGRDMLAVRDALCHCYNGNTLGRVIYTESHDEVANGRQRTPEEIWPGNAGSWFSRKRSTLGAALVFTAPGIPMIFQGQEFLEDGYFRDTVPLDWTKLETYAGIHLLYRNLIRLSRNWFNQTGGLRGQHINVHHINQPGKLIAFHRWENGGPGDDVVVVANFANRAYESYSLGFPKEGLWRVRFNSDWQGYSADFGNHPGYDTTASDSPLDDMPFRANVGIGPYSVLILSQDNS